MLAVVGAGAPGPPQKRKVVRRRLAAIEGSTNDDTSHLAPMFCGGRGRR